MSLCSIFINSICIKKEGNQFTEYELRKQTPGPAFWRSQRSAPTMDTGAAVHTKSVHMLTASIAAREVNYCRSVSSQSLFPTVCLIYLIRAFVIDIFSGLRILALQRIPKEEDTSDISTTFMPRHWGPSWWCSRYQTINNRDAARCWRATLCGAVTSAALRPQHGFDSHDHSPETCQLHISFDISLAK
jgi:hypothetical protein